MKLAILGPSKNNLSYTTSRLLEEAKKEFSTELVPLIDIKLKVSKELDILYDKKSMKDIVSREGAQSHRSPRIKACGVDIEKCRFSQLRGKFAERVLRNAYGCIKLLATIE